MTNIATTWMYVTVNQIKIEGCWLPNGKNANITNTKKQPKLHEDKERVDVPLCA